MREELSSSDGNVQTTEQRLSTRVEFLENTLHRMEASRSWRWTMPLRKAEMLLRTMPGRIDAFMLRNLLRKRKMLICDYSISRYNHNSGEQRMFRIVQLLRSLRCDITFIPYDGIERPQYAEILKNMGVRVLVESISAHLEAEGRTYDTIMLCRMPHARLQIDDVRRLAPQATVLFDTVDVHYLRLTRQADIQGGDFLRSESALWKQREIELMHKTDCTVVVSEVEKNILGRDAPDIPVFLVSNIVDVIARPQWSAHRTNMLFLGNMYHEPNMDALSYLLADILPLIRRHLPFVQLDVVGDFPAGRMDKLRYEGVHMHGHQPDLAPFFASAFACVAPLRFGAGVKGKLHTSMSYGVPFVTSSIGAEAMHVQDGQSAFIADDPVEFAERVARLHTDHLLWENMADASQKVLRSHASAKAARKTLQTIFIFLDKHAATMTNDS